MAGARFLFSALGLSLRLYVGWVRCAFQFSCFRQRDREMILSLVISALGQVVLVCMLNV